MSSLPNKTVQNLDERRAKILEMVKERLKTADHILKDKQKKTGIEGRLEESEENLKELIEYGDELVTNIKVSGEMREIQRRNFEEARKKALLDDLSKESLEAMAMFDNITGKWSELKEFKEPVAMFNQLEQQKQRIGDLMASKDTIIDKCESEINRVSDKYYADQENQSAEISSLIERIDSQVELIKQAYKSHLDLLQDAIEEERLNMAHTEATRWEELFENMKSNAERKLNIEKEKQAFYFEEIDKLCREQEEITRATRIRLERDSEILQLELRNTQNNVLMNSEKLDYNYQVLQKRNEENVIINNQQKRRVGRFKETISALKAKIHTIKGRAQLALKKMEFDVEKLYANISELEKKSEEFLRANEKKYRYVWNINYQEALSLTNRIYEIDRLLHEQQLGVIWIPQHVKGISYDQKTNTTTGRPLMSLEMKSSEKGEKELDKKTKLQPIADKTVAQQLAEIRLLRSILKKISDRGGFLIENKLLKILEPYTDYEKCLVRIDNIFNALRITDYSDITSLTQYFLPYAWCPNCSDGQFTEVVDQLTERVEERTHRGRGSLEQELDKSIEDDASSISDVCSLSTDDIETNINYILTVKKKTKDEEKNIEQKTCSNHYLVIKSAFILTALRNFTEKHLKKHRGSFLGSFEQAIVRSSKTTRPLAKESAEKFWSNFLQVMPFEKQKLWKTLEHGLQHYSNILKEREQLDLECEFLRQQNRELRYLLKKHLPSDV